MAPLTTVKTTAETDKVTLKPGHSSNCGVRLIYSRLFLPPPPPLPPSPPFTPTPIIRNQEQQRKMTSPSPTSPLDIPEILEKIHSFVDLHTLQHSVIYVCRQWFFTNRHRISRELLWEYHFQNENMERAVPVLGYFERVALFFRSVNSDQCRVENEAWNLFLKTLKEIHEQQQHQQELQQQEQDRPDTDSDVVGSQDSTITNLKLFEPTPIMDFSISGTYPSTKLYDLMPFLSNITRLRVEQRMNHHVYPDRIFRGCPHLLSLHVGSETRIEMFREWLPLPPDQQQPLPLQSLSLENAYLVQAKLEEFLQFTPHLANLQLSNLSIQGMSAIAENGVYDCKHLIECIKRQKIPLNTFHFSIYDRFRQFRDCLVDEELFQSICQDSREWTFATGDLTPQLLRNIGHLPNTITTLNMVNRDTVFHNSTSKLHEFLCSSPQLLHLRIPRTTYHLSHLDLYRRMPSILVGDRSQNALDAEAIRNPNPGVWACRRLQTLHISFEIPGARRAHARVEHSRIAFGYIAKVCPELRELKIISPSHREGTPVSQYELAGGSCLLAKLKHLEVLRIGSSLDKRITSLHDLDWMTLPQRTESTEKSREERRKIVAQWRGQISAEANKDKKRMTKQRTDEFPRTAANTLGWMYCDNELKNELYRVGLLLDVKMMIERIDSTSEQGQEEVRCWPNLQRIDFGSFSPFGLASAEQELKRLFSS